MSDFIEDIALNINTQRLWMSNLDICCSVFERVYTTVQAAVKSLLQNLLPWKKAENIALTPDEMGHVLHKLKSWFQVDFVLMIGGWGHCTTTPDMDVTQDHTPTYVKCGASIICNPPSPIHAQMGPTGRGAATKNLSALITNQTVSTLINSPTAKGNVNSALMYEDVSPVPVESPDSATVDQPPSASVVNPTNQAKEDFDFSMECLNALIEAEVSHTNREEGETYRDTKDGGTSETNHSVIVVHSYAPIKVELNLTEAKNSADSDGDWEVKLDDVRRKFRETYDVTRGGSVKKRSIQHLGMSPKEKKLITAVLKEKPCEINRERRLELFEQNLELIKQFEVMNKRLITFMQHPIKLLCEEI